jgi:hypothetical protein
MDKRVEIFLVVIGDCCILKFDEKMRNRSAVKRENKFNEIIDGRCKSDFVNVS